MRERAAADSDCRRSDHSVLPTQRADQPDLMSSRIALSCAGQRAERRVGARLSTGNRWEPCGYARRREYRRGGLGRQAACELALDRLSNVSCGGGVGQDESKDEARYESRRVDGVVLVASEPPDTALDERTYDLVHAALVFIGGEGSVSDAGLELDPVRVSQPLALFPEEREFGALDFGK